MLNKESTRIRIRNLYGTGFTLSSAIAGHQGLDAASPHALGLARDFILGALAAGADVTTGGGNGPLNHGFGPVPTRRLPGAAG